VNEIDKRPALPYMHSEIPRFTQLLRVKPCPQTIMCTASTRHRKFKWLYGIQIWAISILYGSLQKELVNHRLSRHWMSFKVQCYVILSQSFRVFQFIAMQVLIQKQLGRTAIRFVGVALSLSYWMAHANWTWHDNYCQSRRISSSAKSLRPRGQL